MSKVLSFVQTASCESKFKHSKVLLFSDIHIAIHKRSIERLHDCLKTLEWVFQTARDQKIEDIIFGGDLFQDRQKIDVLTYHLTFNVISQYCSKNMRLWLLLGNHDLWYHDRWDISSIKPLSAIEGVTVIERPCTLNIADNLVDFLPYTQQPLEHLDLLRSVKRPGRRNLVAHLAVNGAKLNTLHDIYSDVMIEHDGEMTVVGADVFEGWDQVWLGHYHGQQKLSDSVEYIGSPLQLSFGEAFQHKHVIVYDLEKGDKEYIRNKFSPQHFIIPETDVEKYDIEKNFIRLSVPDRTSADVVQIKNVVQQLKPGTLEIVQQKKEENQQVVKDAKAILLDEDKMVETWVEQVETKLESERLCEIGKKVCIGPAEQEDA